MKVKVYGYVHEPRISLQIVPETENEEQLLNALWVHGYCERIYNGFSITTRKEKAHEPVEKTS